MAGKPTLDKEMYKPSHERSNPTTALGKIITRKFIEESLDFKKKTDRRIAYSEGKRCIQTPIFSPLDPSEPINGKESQQQNKIILTIMIVTGILIFLGFMLTERLMQLLSLSLIPTLIVEVIFGIMLEFFIVSKVVLKVEENRISESKNRGNKALSMGSIWGISPSGITEKRLNNVESTSVFYSGKEAIVLKLLKKSVLVSNSMVDWLHYDSLKTMEDILIKNGFIFSKFNCKYDTNNDYIWSELDSNLAKSVSTYGKEYSNIMKKFLTYQRKQTEALSSVTVVYYIIMPEFIYPKIEYERLISELKVSIENARCVIGDINNKEFLRLIKNYYGLENLDLEEISENIAQMNDTFVDVETLRIVNSDGELIEMREYFDYNIQNFYNKVPNNLKEKDFHKPKFGFEADKESIFGDKVINQIK